MSKIISVAEAARQLHVSERYVRRLCRDKRLEAEPFGKWTWMIDPESVMAFSRLPDGRCGPRPKRAKKPTKQGK